MFSCFAKFRIIVFDLYFIRNVAQSSANFPVFCGHARQRGRGFGALAQTLGRTAIPFIKNIYIVPAEKTIGENFLELLLQRLEKLSADEKNLKHLQKMLQQN